MEKKKRSVWITFTVLSLAAAVMMGFQYVGVYAYRGIIDFLNKNQEAGGLRWLSWLFHSPWTDMIMQYLFLMGAAYLPIYLMICWLPKDTQKSRKLSGKDFLVSTVMAMGLGYIFNLAGTFINMLISNITGASFMDMNPVADLMESITPAMIIYTCVLGPFMEELLCRGFLLKRARVFGDWTAVVFTAVIFGMMHGNIAQFLYATVIGLILGYVAVKTNGIRYTVLIHVVINTYNMALGWGETLIWETGSDLLLAMYSLAVILNMVVLMVGGVIAMVKYAKIWYRQMVYHNRPQPVWEKDNPDIAERTLEEPVCLTWVYLNPGFLIYGFLCLIEFMHYLTV